MSRVTLHCATKSASNRFAMNCKNARIDSEEGFIDYHLCFQKKFVKCFFGCAWGFCSERRQGFLLGTKHAEKIKKRTMSLPIIILQNHPPKHCKIQDNPHRLFRKRLVSQNCFELLFLLSAFLVSDSVIPFPRKQSTKILM